MAEVDFMSVLHNSTQRDYLARVNDPEYPCQTVVRIYREDIWANSLRQELDAVDLPNKPKYINLAYEANIESHLAQVEMAMEYVQLHQATRNPRNLCVLALGYAEIIGMLENAQDLSNTNQSNIWDNIPWYTADGFTFNASLFESEKATSFALKTRLKSTTFVLPEPNSKIQAFETALLQNFGITKATPYMANSYDAAQIVIELALQDEISGQKFSGLRWKKTFEEAALKIERPTSGEQKLTPEGDRDLPNQFGAYEIAVKDGSSVTLEGDRFLRNNIALSQYMKSNNRRKKNRISGAAVFLENAINYKTGGDAVDAAELDTHVKTASQNESQIQDWALRTFVDCQFCSDYAVKSLSNSNND